MSDTTADELLTKALDSLGLDPRPADVELRRGGSLPSVFAVSDLAQASVAAAGVSLSAYLRATGRQAPPVVVDRDLASAWFALSARPLGWTLPPVWDAIAGDYPAADGWIRLHTNAPRHRAAVVAVLGADERDTVATAVAGWSADELEDAVVRAGGAAAAMRTQTEWADHPQGRAVAPEPLLHVERTDTDPGGSRPDVDPSRPLAGTRVLDLTRVLAGPVATRLLAGWGAEVLRVDPPDWNEAAIEPEVTLGKRCARLDLRAQMDREHLLGLLESADVMVHGYRPDALDGLGLGASVRAERRPGLVDVSLDAYGWSGPWSRRRGFDSLVQMSTGIAATGQAVTGADRPVPLPVQALDHATGYLLAAATLSGLTIRRLEGLGTRWRASLARTASVLVAAGIREPEDRPPPAPLLWPGGVEHTPWGDIERLAPPVVVDGAPLHWSRGAVPLGTDQPYWSETGR